MTGEFWDFAAELTDLAEVILSAALAECGAELRAQYGAPLLEDGLPCGLSLVALGKCGGRELGFASDVELLFVYAGPGQTTGPKIVDTTEYFEQMVRSIVSTLQSKREGIFQIDLQLRPYGKAGSMAVSLDSFRRYFAPDGPAWAYERQALVKLRPIIGDTALSEELIRLRDQYSYESGLFDVTAMRAMRERQVRHKQSECERRQVPRQSKWAVVKTCWPQ